MILKFQTIPLYGNYYMGHTEPEYSAKEPNREF